ncbi:DUF397 domain-containing protein [Kitasatospora sp. NPDC048538]|uniref:DUF397 domain-containing protein n=1 Tax=unclassified Kitasatospora TaxID=2633591 RepID=UPI0033E587D1
MTDNEWQKSTFSGSTENCVEVRAADEAIELRESDEAHTILRTTPTTFAALLQAIKSGEHHHP